MMLLSILWSMALILIFFVPGCVRRISRSYQEDDLDDPSTFED
jgi:hypothetical protein